MFYLNLPDEKQLGENGNEILQEPLVLRITI